MYEFEPKDSADVKYLNLMKVETIWGRYDANMVGIMTISLNLPDLHSIWGNVARGIDR